MFTTRRGGVGGVRTIALTAMLSGAAAVRWRLARARPRRRARSHPAET